MNALICHATFFGSTLFPRLFLLAITFVPPPRRELCDAWLLFALAAHFCIYGPVRFGDQKEESKTLDRFGNKSLTGWWSSLGPGFVPRIGCERCTSLIVPYLFIYRQVLMLRLHFWWMRRSGGWQGGSGNLLCKAICGCAENRIKSSVHKPVPSLFLLNSQTFQWLPHRPMNDNERS